MSPVSLLDFAPATTSANTPLVTALRAPAPVAPVVVQRVEVQPVPERAAAAADLLATSSWTWRELRDYALREIERRHGPQPRNFAKEKAIFDGFISRWGIDAAIKITRTAFDVHDGMWRNAPISISRFAKGSDPYFAQVIAARSDIISSARVR